MCGLLVLILFRLLTTEGGLAWWFWLGLVRVNGHLLQQARRVASFTSLAARMVGGVVGVVLGVLMVRRSEN